MLPIAAYVSAGAGVIVCVLGWFGVWQIMRYIGVMPNWKSLGQDVLAAAAGAIVPFLPALLDQPPSITPRELGRMALSAVCVVIALYVKKHKATADEAAK